MISAAEHIFSQQTADVWFELSADAEWERNHSFWKSEGAIKGTM